MKAWENGGPYVPPEGWTFTQRRHGAHACGWLCVVPMDEPARFQAEVRAHGEACPWPEMPEPTDTPSG